MEIRKVISILAALTLSASMFTACGGNEDKSSTEETTAEAQEEETTEEATEEEETTEESEEETTEEASEEATEEGTEESAENGDSNAEAGDITVSMDGSESTEEAPVKLGEWATIGIYAAEDETYHNVNMRITKVTTSSGDQKYVDDAVALNNKCSSEYGQLNVDDLKIPSDCELCIVDYEINIPSDFPTAEWGVTSPSVSLSVENTDGAGFPSKDGASSYIGLSTTSSLELEEDTEYKVGNTYAFRCCFIMVQDYEKFAFKVAGYPEGTTDVSDGSRYEAHFASR